MTAPRTYSAMCEAIEKVHSTFEADLDQMSPDDQLRVCLHIPCARPRTSNQDRRDPAPGRARIAEGLEPKNKRDAKWLVSFEPLAT